MSYKLSEALRYIVLFVFFFIPSYFYVSYAHYEEHMINCNPINLYPEISDKLIDIIRMLESPARYVDALALEEFLSRDEYQLTDFPTTYYESKYLILDHNVHKHFPERYGELIEISNREFSYMTDDEIKTLKYQLQEILRELT